MVALRAMGLVILWLVLSGAGCGALMGQIIRASTLYVSYPATLQRTRQASLEALKELGFEVEYSKMGSRNPWWDPPFKWFTITASRAADEFSVDIFAKSFDPTSTCVFIGSNVTYDLEGIRKSINRNISERLGSVSYPATLQRTRPLP